MCRRRRLGPLGMISVIIAKPTKLCNADCSYCSSPPDGAKAWGDAELETLFKALEGNVTSSGSVIWHGGEPMLMGPDFYYRAWEIAQKYTPGLKFSLQSNLLLYKSKLWKDLFTNVFKGSVSTSYDPDETQRTIKGSTTKYNNQFFRKLDEVMADGFNPLVIGTFTEQTSDLMHLMYDKSIERENPYHIRLNYCSPVGREAGAGLLIEPELYGAKLIEIYDRWIDDVPGFVVTPLDLMLGKVLGLEGERCPWTRRCGGSFLGVMPNGDIYNCGDFSDVSEDWRYGNIFAGTYTPARQAVNFYKKTDVTNIIPAMLGSPAAVQIKRREALQPLDCQTCRHFAECQGGCVRDVVLYDRGIGGKFMYCRSWKMVFDHIKTSILNGRADRMIQWLGKNPDVARTHLHAISSDDDLLRWS